ncbi:MAG: hypothetical protein U9M91_03765 [Chloroflexota bacterium]|nr:hypothetical protein [Chloroflexota bacterium]
MEEAEALRAGARYIALAEIGTQGRIVTGIVRFYIKTDGKVLIEDKSDQSITLIGKEEVGKHKQWQEIGRFTQSIMESIIKALVEVLLRRW